MEKPEINRREFLGGALALGLMGKGALEVSDDIDKYFNPEGNEVTELTHEVANEVLNDLLSSDRIINLKNESYNVSGIESLEEYKKYPKVIVSLESTAGEEYKFTLNETRYLFDDQSGQIYTTKENLRIQFFAHMAEHGLINTRDRDSEMKA